ncbi:MAG: glycosyltransferase family 9 protein [Caldimicrobium sp.]|nr:glycosyltransferase family 9 protein [Caldimicrobium sp.]
MGDTLLTFPLLEALKREDYYIVYLGQEEYVRLAKLCGWADEALSSEYLSYFMNEPFDRKIIISMEGNLEPFPRERIWLPQYYLEKLGLPKKFSPILPIAQRELPRKKIALIHPGSGSPKKNPPMELFERIEAFLKTWEYEVFYLAGEAEQWLLSQKKNVLFSKDLLEVTKIFRLVDIYVGNDSGISHLASYLGVSSYLFYGPTDEVVFKPIGTNYRILTLPLPCRPCFPETCESRSCLDGELLWEVFLKNFTQAL